MKLVHQDYDLGTWAFEPSDTDASTSLYVYETCFILNLDLLRTHKLYFIVTAQQKPQPQQQNNQNCSWVETK